jgi:hypothetical protein
LVKKYVNNRKMPRYTRRKDQRRATNSSNVPLQFKGTVVGVRGVQQNQFNVDVNGRIKKYKIGRNSDRRMAVKPEDVYPGATVLLRKDTRHGRTRKQYPKIVAVVSKSSSNHVPYYSSEKMPEVNFNDL